MMYTTYFELLDQRPRSSATLSRHFENEALSLDFLCANECACVSVYNIPLAISRHASGTCLRPCGHAAQLLPCTAGNHRFSARKPALTRGSRLALHCRQSSVQCASHARNVDPRGGPPVSPTGGPHTQGRPQGRTTGQPQRRTARTKSTPDGDHRSPPQRDRVRKVDPIGEPPVNPTGGPRMQGRLQARDASLN